MGGALDIMKPPKVSKGPEAPAPQPRVNYKREINRTKKKKPVRALGARMMQQKQASSVGGGFGGTAKTLG